MLVCVVNGMETAKVQVWLNYDRFVKLRKQLRTYVIVYRFVVYIVADIADVFAGCTFGYVLCVYFCHCLCPSLFLQLGL